MSGLGNLSDINQTFIIEPVSTDVLVVCAGVDTNIISSCSSSAKIFLSANTIFNSNIVPLITDTIDIGTILKRFRDINTVSGTSTVWTSTNKLITPILDLGLDLSGNSRQITADNSIIANDILNGGSY